VSNDKSSAKQLDEAFAVMKKTVDPILTAAYRNSAAS
jgi:hypothetical protein